jgi:hypothetical protein
MASFKSHPFFYTTLLLIGAVTAGQAWLVFSQRSQTKRLAAEVEQKERELQAFGRQNPFPSTENVGLVEADRVQAEKTRSEIRQILRASGEIADRLAAAPVPASPTDSYFDIANYVERIRDAAREAGVALPSENRLGFSIYSSTGPERELIEPVFRQRQRADYLMGVLLEARPREIISLQRERPLTAAQRQQLAEGTASGQGFGGGSAEAGDFFAIDPRVSARVAGFVETMPFRFSFVGTTGSLRSVLNQLAKFDLPVVVRSVEVEPLTRTETRQSPRPASNNPFSLFGGDAPAVAADAEKPLVEQTDSRFVVTVEFVSLVEKPSEQDASLAPAATNP